MCMYCLCVCLVCMCVCVSCPCTCLSVCLCVVLFVEQLLDCRASRSHTTRTRQRPRSSCSGGSVTACWLFRMHDSRCMCIHQKSYAIDIIDIIDECNRSHRHNVRSKFELVVYFEKRASSNQI